MPRLIFLSPGSIHSSPETRASSGLSLRLNSFGSSNSEYRCCDDGEFSHLLQHQLTHLVFGDIQSLLLHFLRQNSRQIPTRVFVVTQHVDNMAQTPQNNGGAVLVVVDQLALLLFGAGQGAGGIELNVVIALSVSSPSRRSGAIVFWRFGPAASGCRRR